MWWLIQSWAKKKKAGKSSYNFHEGIPSEDERQENRDGSDRIDEDIMLNVGEDVISGDDLDVPRIPFNGDLIDEELEEKENEELEENEEEYEDEYDYAYMRFDDNLNV